MKWNRPSALAFSRGALASAYLFLVLIFSFSTSLVLAETPGDSYDEIIEKGEILFGVYKDFPPYSFHEDGKLKGIDIEVGKLIAEGLKVKAKFRAVGADENVDDDLRNNVWKGHYLGGGVVNVMLHVPYHRELDIRNELVVLTGRYFQERIGLSWRKDRLGDAPNMLMLAGHKLGAELDSLADFYLLGFRGGAMANDVVHFGKPDDAMKALGTGEVSAVAGLLGQLEYGRRHAADVIETGTPPMPGLRPANWTLGIAIRHNYRQLGYAVDEILYAATTDGRLERIFADFGLTYTAPQ